MPMTIAAITPWIHHSRLVVGHAYSAFKDHGAKATCPPQDATRRKKGPVKNTSREKNEMLCKRSKIRVLHKAYKQVFEQLYTINIPRLAKQE
jgi:hypothetical protein